MDPYLIAVCMLFSLLGCAVGVVTGLIPGIHVNTMASLVLLFYPGLRGLMVQYLEPDHVAVSLCCLIMSASVVHSFMDFIPSVFLGAPDAEDAISILPGHRLLLKGQGMIAVRSAAIGSLIGCSAAIILAIPMQYIMMAGLADNLDNYTKIVLLAVSFLILYNEFRRGNILMGMTSFLLAGALGWMVMRLPIPASGVMGEGTLLMPMLSGLFGLPTMLTAAEGKPFPKQIDKIKDPVGLIPGLKGVIMGSVAGWFPGITSTVGATISATIMPDRSPERFISTVASIGTVTTVLSLVTLSISGGGRSGTVIVIGQILGDSITGFATVPFVMLLIAASAASMIGYALTIGFGRAIASFLSRVRQDLMNRSICILLIILTLCLTGPWGMIILLAGTLIGFVPVSNDTGKTVLCACLILPVLVM
ncbi:MAG: hypothetical protein E7Z65_02230 [Thermoplasmata archaeon]|nr:hypothetical protein [Thermoplasmata archaeon]